MTCFSDPETIKIIDVEPHPGIPGVLPPERACKHLMIDGQHRATLRVVKSGEVSMSLEVCGFLQWPQTRVLLLGLLELSLVADYYQTQWETKTSGKKKRD